MRKGSVVVIARFTAAGGKVDALQSVLEGLVEPTRAEKGCVSYELLKNKAGGEDLIFVEEWRSRGDLDAHMCSEHLKAAVEKLSDVTALEPDIQFYELIC